MLLLLALSLSIIVFLLVFFLINIAEVTISDTKLKQALIEQGIDRDKNGFISKNELYQVEKLDLSDQLIQNLDGLQYLQNIKWLDLSGNHFIEDLAPIKDLISLEYLDANTNSINNTQFMSNLIQLETLDISSNKISNIDPIGNLK
jgi:Leucine-rich repeat (LRR) protein